jgi:hypothetical protein
MELLKVILLAIALFSIGMLGMAITILVKKGGKFPNTHVSGNKHLQKNGVYCAQTQDKIEQRKGRRKITFDKLTIASDIKAGK